MGNALKAMSEALKSDQAGQWVTIGQQVDMAQDDAFRRALRTQGE